MFHGWIENNVICLTTYYLPQQLKSCSSTVSDQMATPTTTKRTGTHFIFTCLWVKGLFTSRFAQCTHLQVQGYVQWIFLEDNIISCRQIFLSSTSMVYITSYQWYWYKHITIHLMSLFVPNYNSQEFNFLFYVKVWNKHG